MASTADTVAATIPLPVSQTVADDAPSVPPVLRAAAGGHAERLAARIGQTHPVRVFLAAVLSGYALLVGLTVSAGLAFTELLVPVDRFERWDDGINTWLAERRSPGLEDASWVGSTLAGGLVIPVLVGVLLLTFAVRRRWLLAAFTLFVICVESGTYRATTLMVHRDRPPVDRLEGLPVDASFPSGHTAASVALFGGLLLVLASWVGRRWFTVAVVLLEVAVVSFVAWARLYRGMHHITDVAAGVVIGVLALVVTVFATRAAQAAAERRAAVRTPSPEEPT